MVKKELEMTLPKISLDDLFTTQEQRDYNNAEKVEDLKTCTNEEERTSDINDIIMASNCLLELVNGILDISKIEAGKMEIVETEYQPIQVFDDIVKLIKPRIGEKPI